MDQPEVVAFGDQLRPDQFKELQLDPALKGPMDRGLIAVDFRDPVPLAAGANPKDNAIQDAPGVGTFPPGRTGRIELID